MLLYVLSQWTNRKQVEWNFHDCQPQQGITKPPKKWMASGGSTPPTHLSIPQLPKTFLASTSSTLQTPQLTLTPVTSISSAGESGSKSFTSLEELLNITGINTPDSRPSNSDNGVASLNRIAQAVESGQKGSQEEPPAKKPRLDPPPSNIRVQPLATLPLSQPSVTIASLLNKKPLTSTNHPTTPFSRAIPGSNSGTMGTSNSMSLGRPVSTTAVIPPISPAPIQAVVTSPTLSSVIPSLMQTTPTSTASGNPKSFLLQLVQLYKRYQTAGDNDGMDRIKKQLNVLVAATQGRSGPNTLPGSLSTLTSPTSTAASSTPSLLNPTLQFPINSSAPLQTNITSTLTPSPGHISLLKKLPVSAAVSKAGSSHPVPPSLLNSQLRAPSGLKAASPVSQAAVTSAVSVGTRQGSPALSNRSSGSITQGSQGLALASQLSVQHKVVKQLQNIMNSLPVSNRPKTAQEIKDFVQKYSNLISQIQSATTLPGTAQSNKTLTPQPATKLSDPAKSSTPTGTIAVPLNFGPSTSKMTSTQLVATSISSTAMAQVDQHFQIALTAAKMKTSQSINTKLPSKPLPTVQPPMVDLTKDTESSTNSTFSAPVTNQFKANTPKSGGIQAGVATPLPPGLTLETLAVLCRLPESELEKLKLPVGLLSAIKVWKEKQPAKKGTTTQSKTSSSSGNIPVLLPPSQPSKPSFKTPTMKVGDALSLTTSQSGDFKKPFVIPSSAGFPPRSLHAYVPGMVGARSAGSSSNKLFTPSTTPHRPNSRTTSHHMTRVRTKAEQEKAEKERVQALTKALQSSEEARIAFQFSAHLDKMHSQLLAPDTNTPFADKQDMLARLLPYHVYAECEPPPAAVEKADAVFESVAQVLLSRSRGLQSRFQQLLAKEDSQGGGEVGVMGLELQRCFIKGEQERIQQEKIKKQQAEQVAADLSMMVRADDSDAFQSGFSLDDAFYPFIDNGIT